MEGGRKEKGGEGRGERGGWREVEKKREGREGEKGGMEGGRKEKVGEGRGERGDGGR